MIERSSIKEMVRKLAEISSSSDNLYLEEIEKLRKLLEDKKYRVAVIGEFSSGKSTILNAILGKRILYSSNNEATGVVTLLEHGEKEEALVYSEGKCIAQIPLNTLEGRDKLEEYVSINNKKDKVSGINIKYPMEGIDKDIYLIDTPGLQGISEKQMETTREALKEANATIMLISYNGLTEKELALLAGKNEKFGRIKTKDIFLVMNKIGELYDGKSKEEAEAKIQQAKQEVMNQLKSEEIENMSIFAVDSRDYLWSKDNELYGEVLKKNSSTINSILEQNAYRERSKFQEFKSFLYNFLESGQRNINFLEDITEKLEIIIDAFIEKFSTEESLNERKKNDLKALLNEEKELLIKNKRKLYNSLARYISSSFEEFYNSAEEDIKSCLQDRNKQIAQIIDKEIDDKSKLSQCYINICTKKVKEIISKDCTEFEKKINTYQSKMNEVFISKKFNEEFSKMFNKKSYLQIKVNSSNVKINFKMKDLKFNEDDVIKDMELEIAEFQRSIDELKQKIEKGKAEDYEYHISILEVKENAARGLYETRKKQLGSRIPEPTQKYSYKTKTRRKFLFFKEEYKEKVPDGLDYDMVNKWNEDTKKNQYKYEKQMKEIKNDLEYYEGIKRSLNKYQQEINEINEKIIDLRKEIDEVKKSREKKRKENEKGYLAEKKNEIYKSIVVFQKQSYEAILDGINENLFKLNNDIKEKIKGQIEIYLDNYAEQLDLQIEQISSKASVGSDNYEMIMSELHKLKGMVK